jgi:hypothetical protein
MIHFNEHLAVCRISAAASNQPSISSIFKRVAVIAPVDVRVNAPVDMDALPKYPCLGLFVYPLKPDVAAQLSLFGMYGKLPEDGSIVVDRFQIKQKGHLVEIINMFSSSCTKSRVLRPRKDTPDCCAKVCL